MLLWLTEILLYFSAPIQRETKEELEENQYRFPKKLKFRYILLAQMAAGKKKKEDNYLDFRK